MHTGKLYLFTVPKAGTYFLAGLMSWLAVRGRGFCDWGPCIPVVTGAILFDGLSQTQLWFELFGVPGPSETSLLLIGLLVLLAAWVASIVLGIICLSMSEKEEAD